MRDTSPVRQYLHIQSHLDVQQVVVFPQVTGHVKFAVYELILKFFDCVLEERRWHITGQNVYVNAGMTSF